MLPDQIRMFNGILVAFDNVQVVNETSQLILLFVETLPWRNDDTLTSTCIFSHSLEHTMVLEQIEHDGVQITVCA